jgi:hypothetical protein
VPTDPANCRRRSAWYARRCPAAPGLTLKSIAPNRDKLILISGAQLPTNLGTDRHTTPIPISGGLQFIAPSRVVGQNLHGRIAGASRFVLPDGGLVRAVGAVDLVLLQQAAARARTSRRALPQAYTARYRPQPSLGADRLGPAAQCPRVSVTATLLDKPGWPMR